MENKDFELQYLRTVNSIQDSCIKGQISKKECEQQLEIERLKYIAHLKAVNEMLKDKMYLEKCIRKNLLGNLK